MRRILSPMLAATDADFTFSVPMFALLVGLCTVLWFVGAYFERRKLQPEIDREKQLRIHAELKRSEQVQQADEFREKAEAAQADLSRQIKSLEQQWDEAKKEARAATESARAAGDESVRRLNELRVEIAAGQTKLREAESAAEAVTARLTVTETALDAERGRVTAMQEALEAKQDLAKQLAQELSGIRTAHNTEREAAAKREEELRAKLEDHEKQSASGQSMVDVVHIELEKTRAATAEIEKDYSTKLSDLQRKLSAADQRSALLQKEIMALVSTGSGAAGAAETVTMVEDMHAAQERAKEAAKRIAELEGQLAQGDSGLKKRLREAEYRICELEAKLAESAEG